MAVGIGVRIGQVGVRVGHGWNVRIGRSEGNLPSILEVI